MSVTTAAATPVESDDNCHAIHAYFNVSPESPDGRSVVYFRSRDPEGHFGEVVVRDRLADAAATRVLVQDVETEDGHRVACQQWALGGAGVIYHHFVGGEPRVMFADRDGGAPKVVANDRLVGWSNGTGSLVPIYAPHWRVDGPHDLELVDLATGEVRVVLRSEVVQATFPDWTSRTFGDGPIAIFIPTLSPDATRVFFKLARPLGGDFRSDGASKREGLFVYDIESGSLKAMFEQWRHPAWHPDSRRILNVPFELLDSTTGARTRLPGLPDFPGSHPSVSPRADRMVTDVRYGNSDRSSAEWGIVLVPAHGGSHTEVCRFDNAGGALSWRPPHPHPVFSLDGRRLYFNRNIGPWTKLHMLQL